MRRTVAWPGVAVKRAKGRKYYYWTSSKPWIRLPDPLTDPDGFMRKIAHLQRVEAKQAAGHPGTFSGTVRLYLKSADFTDRAVNTQKLYTTYLERLLVIFGQAPLTDISQGDVQTFVMDEHADTRGAANMMLRVMHIIYKWASARRPGLTDPTTKIDEYDGGEHEAWPEHLLEKALDSDDELFRLAVHLHLYTGQRTGDTCGMTWNALTAEGLIPVKQQKTGTPLLIPQHPRLAVLLDDTKRKTLTILRNMKGTPLRPATFREWVTKFGEANGADLVPHGLRRNAVNALLEAECSTAEVSSVTGQSLAMVEHYAKERNQPKIASAAMLKWGRNDPGTGKLSSSSKTAVAKS
ncbi:tyrosine-type recombinase/integrase [Sphingomonas albertensis]